MFSAGWKINTIQEKTKLQRMDEGKQENIQGMLIGFQEGSLWQQILFLHFHLQLQCRELMWLQKNQPLLKDFLHKGKHADTRTLCQSRQHVNSEQGLEWIAPYLDLDVHFIPLKTKQCSYLTFLLLRGAMSLNSDTENCKKDILLVLQMCFMKQLLTHSCV